MIELVVLVVPFVAFMVWWGWAHPEHPTKTIKGGYFSLGGDSVVDDSVYDAGEKYYDQDEFGLADEFDEWGEKLE